MAEQLPHLNLVFIGHVDAGKSSLCGQILVQSGQVDERTLEKCEKEAKEKGRIGWELAFLIDIDEGERERGKTIDIGKAFFSTNKRRYTLLDSPGHKTYVKNAFTGIAQADIAILVISARKGEFEAGFEKEGQTREHIILAKTTGVSHLIVLINKMDDKTVEWNLDRYNEIVSKLSKFIPQWGFKSTDITFCPCSGLKGTNIKEPYEKYKSLFQILDEIPIPKRNVNGACRMPIFSYSEQTGVGYIIGKIESGTLHKGQIVQIQPTKLEISIMTIVLQDGKEIDQASCGENVMIKTNSLKPGDTIHQGDVLCDLKDPISTTKMFKGEIKILDVPNILITVGSKAILHIHTLTTECEIVKLISKHGDTNNKTKLRMLRANDVGTIMIEVSTSIPIEKYIDTSSRLSRFALRTNDGTIAIGKIVSF